MDFPLRDKKKEQLLRFDLSAWKSKIRTSHNNMVTEFSVYLGSCQRMMTREHFVIKVDVRRMKSDKHRTLIARQMQLLWGKKWKAINDVDGWVLLILGTQGTRMHYGKKRRQYDALVKVLLGDLSFCHSCGCYFNMSRLPKHF